MLLKSPLVAAFFAVAPLPALAVEMTPACQKDLTDVDASFEETQVRLEKAGKADQTEKCAAIKHHVEVMANGINVYLRCLPDGHDKNENLAQLAASVGDFLDINHNEGCASFPLPKLDLPE